MEKVIVLFEEENGNPGLIKVLNLIFPESEIHPIFIKRETPMEGKKACIGFQKD